MAHGRLTAADMSRQPDVLARVVERNGDALDAARRILAGRRVVRFGGLGSSRHVAGYGAETLEQLADQPAAVLAAPGAAVPLTRLEADQAVVLVSQSGETPALLEVARHARKAGCAVLAVVNADAAPLGELADVSLHCHAGRERVVAATASVTAQMLLLRGLAAEVTPGTVRDLAQAVAQLTDATMNVGALPPQHVVAGGFAAQWVADEIALKLAEMAHRLATSESLVDHLHGPAAVLVPTVAFLEPADPNTAAVARMPHVRTLGPGPAFDVELPGTGDPSLDAVVRVVAGQVLALTWSRRLGVDADDPRGLAKVTRTA